MLGLLIFAIVLLIYHIHIKITIAHSYWKKKGIKGPKPNPIFGNVFEVALKETLNHVTWLDKIYKEYPDERVIGIYQMLMPTLIIRDPEIIKKVLIKDFPSFTDRGIHISSDPSVSRNLFTTDGDEWKILRPNLTPLFSTGKIKAMIPLLNTCAEKYAEFLGNMGDGFSRDIYQLNQKYTMRSIMSAAFSLDLDTYRYVEETTAIEKAATMVMHMTRIKRLAFFVVDSRPGIFNYLNIYTDDLLLTCFKKVAKRVAPIAEGKPKIRKDFMDSLIQLKEQGTLTKVIDNRVLNKEMTEELMLAQAITFYVAGFESLAGVMSFMLYELAMHLDIQDRCYKEIKPIMEKYKEKLDYDAIQELQYLSMCFDESLRKYPSAPFLLRQAVTDYTFEDLNMTVDKGTKILISIIAIHMDPKYFPSPEKFDPERFLPENKKNIHDAYLPFGNGPRACIGLRLARVQFLVGVAHFLHKFKVSPCDKTPRKIQIDPMRMTLASVGGISLNIEKRK